MNEADMNKVIWLAGMRKGFQITQHAVTAMIKELPASPDAVAALGALTTATNVGIADVEGKVAMIPGGMKVLTALEEED